MAYALRRPILWASRQPAIKRALVRAPLARRVVGRFIAGEQASDAVAAVRRLRTDGILAAIDRLGEDVISEDQARASRTANLDLIQALDDAGLADGAEVTLKLSALGQALPGTGGALATSHATEVADRAAAAGVRVTLDMEDHTAVETTLEAAESLRHRHPATGVALQAMLFRTADDLPRMAAGGGHVRLVKGAYDEPATVAHTEARDIDRAYARYLGQLFSSDGYPMVATHDPALISVALRLAEESRRTPDEFEFQMLYGIRTAEQRRLAAAGYRVRAYVPYGTDWYGYFTRRLAERPANLAFFLRSFVSR